MKSLSVAALVFLVGCGSPWGPSASRVTELESRVTLLEEKAKLQEARRDANQEKLEACAKLAEERYWGILRLNGKTKPDGSVLATPFVFAQAEKARDAKLRECQMLYGK